MHPRHDPITQTCRLIAEMAALVRDAMHPDKIPAPGTGPSQEVDLAPQAREKKRLECHVADLRVDLATCKRDVAVRDAAARAAYRLVSDLEENRAAADASAIRRASLAASPPARDTLRDTRPSLAPGRAVLHDAHALMDGPTVHVDKFATPPRTKGFHVDEKHGFCRHVDGAPESGGARPARRLHRSLAEFVIAMRRPA